MTLHHALHPIIRRVSPSAVEKNSEARVVTLDDDGKLVEPSRRKWRLNSSLHWFEVRSSSHDDAVARGRPGVVVMDPSGKREAALSLPYVVSCAPGHEELLTERLFGEPNPEEVLHKQIRSWARTWVKSRADAFFADFSGQSKLLARHLDDCARGIGLEAHFSVETDRSKVPEEPELTRKISAYLKDHNTPVEVRYWMHFESRSDVLPEAGARQMEIGAQMDDAVRAYLQGSVRAQDVVSRPREVEAKARAAVDQALSSRALATSHFSFTVEASSLRPLEGPQHVDVVATVTTSHGPLSCRCRGQVSLVDVALYAKNVGGGSLEEWFKNVCAKSAQAELYGQARSELELGFTKLALGIERRIEAALAEAGLTIAGLTVRSAEGRGPAPREVRAQVRVEVPTASYAVGLQARAVLEIVDEARYVDAGRPDMEKETEKALSEEARQRFHTTGAATIHRTKDTWSASLKEAVAARTLAIGYKLASLRIDVEPPKIASRDRLKVSVSEGAALGLRKARVKASVRADVSLGDAVRHKESGVASMETWAEPRLQRALLEVLKDVGLAGVVLEPARVRAGLHQRFQAEVERVGYQLVGLDVDLQHEIKLREDDRVVLVDHRFDTRIGPLKIAIVSTVKLELVNVAKFLESAVDDLKPWIRRELEQATNENLFHRKLTEVSRDKGAVQDAIRQRLNQRAEEIGYHVDQVSTLPTLEFVQGDPFTVEAQLRGLATATQGVTVGLDVAATLRINDFVEVVGDMLNRGMSVRDRLKAEIGRAVQDVLHGVDPNDFCWRFQSVSPSKDPSPGERLDAEVHARLRPYGASDLVVRFKPVKPEIFTKLERFMHERRSLSVKLEPSAEREEITYEGELKIVGVDLAGVEILQARDPDLPELVKAVEGRLRALLMRESPDLLISRERADELEDKVRGHIQGFVPRSFGLGVVLENWHRPNTVVEDQEGRQWEMGASVVDKERARITRAFDAISVKIEQAWVDGSPEQVHELEARRQMLMERLGKLTRSPGPRLGAPEGSISPRPILPQPIELKIGPQLPPATTDAKRPKNKTIHLEVPSPLNGYLTAQASCRATLDVRLTLFVPVSDFDEREEARLLREIQGAIARIVQTLDPGDLHVRFDHVKSGVPSPDERIRKAIDDAFGRRPELLLESADVSVPHGPTHARFQQFKGVSIDIEPRKVVIPGLGLPIDLEASVVVEDVAPEGWDRFERQEIGPDQLRHVTGQVLEDCLRDQPDPTALDLSKVQDMVKSRIGRRLGLSVDIPRLRVNRNDVLQDNRQSELTQYGARIKEITQQLTKLGDAPGNVGLLKRAALEEEKTALEKRVRELQGQRAVEPSRVDGVGA